jgi:uncharacterized membrane protein
MNARTRVSGLVVLSALGIADSWYLAQHALTNTALSCGIDAGKLSGCNTVAQSAYSHIFGIPLGIYGLIFYALVLVAALLYNRTHLAHMLSVRALALLGFAASVYFEAVQIFLIDALCIYCLASFFFTLGILLLTIPLWKNRPKFRATAIDTSKQPDTPANLPETP